MGKLELPAGYEIEENGIPTFENSSRFLYEKCEVCAVGKDCKIQYGLRCAMGDNYPWWHERLHFVRKIGDFVSIYSAEVFCEDFTDPQLELDFGGLEKKARKSA